jgi:ABC-type nitrate/sulfonate/bicarbonate transport system ATPase subunit
VLVMTPRPGHIRAEFAVPLSRPRDRAITTEQEFVRMMRAVRAEIIDGA